MKNVNRICLRGLMICLLASARHDGDQLLRPTLEAMRRSCRLFGDPLRIFPVSVDVEW